MRIGLIGCGVIGTALAEYIGKSKSMALVAMYDINRNAAIALRKKLKKKPGIMPLSMLIRSSELIIEAASKEAVGEILRKANGKNKKILVMSTGGLINRNLLDKIKKTEIIVPSGALGAFDAIKSASVGKIGSITLTTTKHPIGLKDAPYVLKKRLHLEKLRQKKCIFSGNVKEAIKGFPKNINVAATLYLASNFSNKLKIRVMADPNAKTNQHEIEASGEFGKLHFKVENVPSRINPKTSHLAVLSAISALKNLQNNIRIGA